MKVNTDEHAINTTKNENCSSTLFKLLGVGQLGDNVIKSHSQKQFTKEKHKTLPEIDGAMSRASAFGILVKALAAS